MVKVFRVWRNKEALKMECNKRNRNIRYAIFKYSNVKKLGEYLVLQSNIFLYFCDRFSKLKRFFFRFWTVSFYIFDRFVKTKCRTFLRMALMEKCRFFLPTLLSSACQFYCNIKHCILNTEIYTTAGLKVNDL